MPDLTPVSMAACTAAIGEYEVKGLTDTYTVTCSGRWEWHCTCPAFRFKFSKEGDWCKHIVQVKGVHCTWNQLLDGGETVDGRCPECGGEVEYFTAMV